MKQPIKTILPSAQAICRLLHPHAEVVVHDIALNQIVAIFNPYSQRKVGDSSLMAEKELMETLEDCVGPYEKTNWNGRKLKTVSSLIRDVKGQPVGMLCINLDISALDDAQTLISAFINCDHFEPQPEPLFKEDWQSKINEYIHHYLKSKHLSLDALKREDKKSLIQHLNEVGAFEVKRAANYIAMILKISRATVYNYLGEQP